MASVITFFGGTEGKGRFNPATLKQQSVFAAVKNLKKSLMMENNSKWVLRPTLINSVPPQIWSLLQEQCRQELLASEYLPLLFQLRVSALHCLKKVLVSNCIQLTDDHLQFLLSGRCVSELDIHFCPNLTRGALKVINELGTNLTYMKIGESIQILPQKSESTESLAANGQRLMTPNLKALVIWEPQSNLQRRSPSIRITHRTVPDFGGNYWKILLENAVANLESLDLSGCKDLSDIKFLKQAADNLDYLVLCRAEINLWGQEQWSIIWQLKKLRHLDLSGTAVHFQPRSLQCLLTRLPSLTELIVCIERSGNRETLRLSSVLEEWSHKEPFVTKPRPFFESRLSPRENNNILTNPEEAASVLQLYGYTREAHLLVETLESFNDLQTSSSIFYRLPVIDTLLWVAKTNLDRHNVVWEIVHWVVQALPGLDGGLEFCSYDKRIRLEKLLKVIVGSLEMCEYKLKYGQFYCASFGTVSEVTLGVFTIPSLSVFGNFTPTQLRHQLMPAILKAGRALINKFNQLQVTKNEGGFVDIGEYSYVEFSVVTLMLLYGQVLKDFCPDNYLDVRNLKLFFESIRELQCIQYETVGEKLLGMYMLISRLLDLGICGHEEYFEAGGLELNCFFLQLALEMEDENLGRIAIIIHLFELLRRFLLCPCSAKCEEKILFSGVIKKIFDYIRTKEIMQDPDEINDGGFEVGTLDARDFLQLAILNPKSHLLKNPSREEIINLIEDL